MKVKILEFLLVASTVLYSENAISDNDVIQDRIQLSETQSPEASIGSYLKTENKKTSAFDTFSEIYDARNANKIVTLNTNKQRYKISKDGDIENDFVDISVKSDTDGLSLDAWY